MKPPHCWVCIPNEAAPVRAVKGGSNYCCVMSDATPGQRFGALMRDAIARDGRTQDELEAATGISRSTWSRWVRGLAERPPADLVRTACRALRIDPRAAAVSLGYLTEDEVSSPAVPYLDPEIEEVLQILEDPNVPAAEKQQGIAFLRYLRAQHKPPEAM